MFLILVHLINVIGWRAMLRKIVNSQNAVIIARQQRCKLLTNLRTRAGGALHHGEPYLAATVD